MGWYCFVPPRFWFLAVAGHGLVWDLRYGLLAPWVSENTVSTLHQSITTIAQKGLAETTKAGIDVKL